MADDAHNENNLENNDPQVANNDPQVEQLLRDWNCEEMLNKIQGN